MALSIEKLIPLPHATIQQSVLRASSIQIFVCGQINTGKTGGLLGERFKGANKTVNRPSWSVFTPSPCQGEIAMGIAIQQMHA